MLIFSKYGTQNTNLHRNIYSVATSETTYEMIKKVYEALNLPKENIGINITTMKILVMKNVWKI